jgi:hypothetical protein
MLLWAYRNLPNETTGLTPYELLYGRAGRGPLEVLRDTWTGEIDNLPDMAEPVQKYLARLKSDLRIANDVATSNALVRQEAYVNQHNLRAREKTFEEGDQVLILFGDSPSKLHSRWQGPGVIQSRLSSNKYLVSLENGSTRVFHVNHLRPFIVRIAALGVVFESDTDFGHVQYCPTTQTVGVSDDTRFDELDLSHLDSDKQNTLRRLLYKYRDIFDDKPGNARGAEHHIEVEASYKPKMAYPYRIPDRLKV